MGGGAPAGKAAAGGAAQAEVDPAAKLSDDELNYNTLHMPIAVDEEACGVRTRLLADEWLTHRC